jgi:DNA helicase-2/ATP-dependent DNA helicase PcrA
MGNLDKYQIQAAEAACLRSLVLAGAGTGKTTTLIAKAVNVMESLQIDCSEILIITFSRAARLELEERFKATQKIPEIYTFHALALKLLSDYSNEFINIFGFKRFPDIIEDDCKRELYIKVFEEVKNEWMGLPFSVVAKLSSKNRINKFILDKMKRFGLNQKLENFLQKYASFKKEKCLMDYDDLIIFANEMILKSPKIKQYVNSKYKFIMADEFQDTAPDNFLFMKNFINEENGLFFIGDDWQSIYGFRNAQVGYIVEAKKYFPDIKVFNLNINYRSCKEIVSLSGKFISKNKYRTHKKIISGKPGKGIIKLYAVNSFERELELIQKTLSIQDNKTTVGILYRNNYYGNKIKESLKDVKYACSIEYLTMHSSKGMEFDTVIITGVCDDEIPDASNNIEEERRLFYVALSRAKTKLYIISKLNNNSSLAVFAEELNIKASLKI